MNLQPGQLISVLCSDGVLRTDYYRPPGPTVHAELTWQQRLVRKLTPRRWRKPIPLVHNDPIARASRMYDSMAEKLVEMGVCASKGSALRSLGIETAPTPDTPLARTIARGSAGVRPELPNRG